MTVAKVFQHTSFNLDPDAGLTERPDPTQWAYDRLYLNPHARTVYLYLRWLAAKGTRRLVLKQAVQDIASERGRRDWESKGGLSEMDIRRALEELDASGLTRTVADDGEPW